MSSMHFMVHWQKALLLGRRTNFAASLNMASTASPTLALSLWLCLFGNRDSAAWEEPAFVRMSGVPWFRSYCHLLLFRSGGEG